MSPPPLSPGTILIDPDSSLGKRIAGSFAVVPVVVLVFTLIAGLWWAFLIAALVIGIALLAAKDALQAAFGWRSPQLEVAAVPYGLGSRPVVTYRRKPKRPTDITDCVVECQLTCQEQVTYTRGTDTSTETRNVFERVCNGSGQGTADGLVADLELPISAHVGAPSMALVNNRIIWFLRVRAKGPRLPRDTHTFTIDVGALLDPSLRSTVQDS